MSGHWTEADIMARDRNFVGVTSEPVQKVTIPRRGRMNKWEAQYAAQELEPRLLSGEILWYAFEPFKIRLADGAWYTPDFCVQECTHAVFFIEVKGMWREAARLRVKVAAERTPFPICCVTKAKNGEWEKEWFRQ